MALIDDLINAGYLKTPRIIAAFRAIKRKDFLPPDLPHRRIAAEMDEAVAIGFAQTISQPATVAFMLELLQPRPGDKIMDIGYGSGWTSALLAHIVSQNGARGKVVAIERIKPLAEFGKENIAKYGFVKNRTVQCVIGDGSKGYLPQAPYDRILASAAAPSVPPAWEAQLKTDGTIVAPVQNALAKIEKSKNNTFSETRYEGFAFVPLVQGS